MFVSHFSSRTIKRSWILTLTGTLPIGSKIYEKNQKKFKKKLTILEIKHDSKKEKLRGNF